MNPGDVLGANRGPGASNCVFSAAPGETFLLFGGDLADGDSDVFTLDTGGFRVNIFAVLESDADHDGFGDETQDQCPTNASTQGPCPVAPVTPVTTVKRRSARKEAQALRRERQEVQEKEEEVGAEPSDLAEGWMPLAASPRPRPRNPHAGAGQPT